MKTTISIPDSLYARAQKLAKRTSKSCNKLFNDAIRDYLANHAYDEVTKAMNRTYAEVGEESREFISSAVSRILRSGHW
ncbi:MAG TPA: ribbon-helix-helix protein, CopG family [Phycisphaerae bacterium]|nr:ribbon-helix-helix protein, CopG family [Phycisphaerae bacterium]